MGGLTKEQKERYRAQQKARKDAKRAAGICIRCNNDAAPGVALCEMHREQHNAYNRSRGPSGKCPDCGKRCHEKSNRCYRCSLSRRSAHKTRPRSTPSTPVWDRIHELELGRSAKEAAERLGFSYTDLVRYASGKITPLRVVAPSGRCAFFGCDNEHTHHGSSLCRGHREEGDLDAIADRAFREGSASLGWKDQARRLAHLIASEPETLWPQEAEAVRRTESFYAIRPEAHPATPFEIASTTTLRDQSKAVLATLTPREQDVLKMRFFGDKTLEETADDYERSKERIRQIEGKALRKLRHPSRRKRLEPFANPDAPTTPAPPITIGVQAEGTGSTEEIWEARRKKAVHGLKRLRKQRKSTFSIDDLAVVLGCTGGAVHSLLRAGMPHKRTQGHVHLERAKITPWLERWIEERKLVLGTQAPPLSATQTRRRKKCPTCKRKVGVRHAGSVLSSTERLVNHKCPHGRECTPYRVEGCRKCHAPEGWDGLDAPEGKVKMWAAVRDVDGELHPDVGLVWEGEDGSREFKLAPDTWEGHGGTLRLVCAVNHPPVFAGDGTRPVRLNCHRCNESYSGPFRIMVPNPLLISGRQANDFANSVVILIDPRAKFFRNKHAKCLQPPESR